MAVCNSDCDFWEKKFKDTNLGMDTEDPDGLCVKDPDNPKDAPYGIDCNDYKSKSDIDLGGGGTGGVHKAKEITE